MSSDPLQIRRLPKLQDATMLLAFSGWMDGGDVSTGTVRRLIRQLKARRFAHIEPEGFYIYNFPGAMEIAAMFRPHVEIRDAEIRHFELPSNTFYCAKDKNLVFFVGKEPNLNWTRFGESILDLAERIGVSRILFVGSFGGTVPHTREPRLYATVSHESLKPMLKQYGVRDTTYEGPGSFTTYLMTQAPPHGLQMGNLVAEIPAYLSGTNPASIEAVTRRLATILGLEVDLAELRGASDEWESQVSKAVEEDPELAEQIRELEAEYDEDLLSSMEEE